MEIDPLSHYVQSLIVGYILNDLWDKALDLYKTIPSKPNDIFYALLYNACASLSNKQSKDFGMKLLNQMPKKYFDDAMVMNSAIDMLMKFGDVTDAERLFQSMKKKTIVTYGAMMNGYNINYTPYKSVELLQEIKQPNLSLNEIASISLIKACSQIGLISTCQRVLTHIPVKFHHNPRLTAALIDMWVSISC